MTPAENAKLGEVPTTAPTAPEKAPALTLREFFESVAPNKEVQLSITLERSRTFSDSFEIVLPPIELFCSSRDCNGVRLFDPSASIHLKRSVNHYVNYSCRNCKQFRKTYSLSLYYDRAALQLTVFKYGELPQFGPPPSRLIRKLVGAEAEYYAKGMQAERQGMGIAAFAYYRRVIEHQKSKIFEEVIRVAELLREPPALIEELQAAKEEKQFTKGVDRIKHAIPQALRISGHNPLTLLHSALSDGMHEQTDEYCLGLATSVRTVLTEFVERVALVLKDETDLQRAVGRLTNRAAKD